ncbi:bifunctional diaminohydroxyphosphoribosylaminopyrimidine deaminase/5-amino-6-(5-phosphoribosylamino)uracil reductase RibD [Blochmannia endosymbiont of Colobopsis nipponica]|uniref:bifunctional diaminohydroxyphosphoribosylaminopyrimidine deaminase/5-amino-6-(5-phosphoribosylamino)uracil reductase RibD n=1 Tax=Blochmannia endosymbiont of Colobopsis nipponica TaxID=2681987 RepID=UPI00177B1691|nr:bifunctional diaminohydroxyphosphoribosylaminopyrimidine deaminase/5-amino-6-(5-phosphoribosylamino)uracil reductase RibD [Blochmannia endosymbiont of Colobopsis nipponica]QOI11191.1 bifunctional diaminohydroxyphosphoribosylaminopyrimidine deaminase/5-amino-6-(5-phosphoribosylamino)uracil reductase RibD [Blochmannia endosymbiont of Colobopsis nipponica]
MLNDEIFLSRAFTLALRGRFTTSPNPNVGCVVILNNKIVGEGYHLRIGEDHAEVIALGSAGSNACGSTVYVTLEPCNHYGRTPPCTIALLKAGVSEVVISTLDPNPYVKGNGITYLSKVGIKVRHGLMLSTGEKINKGFFKRMRTGFPWVKLKLAMTLDGRTAMKNGVSQWITSDLSRQDVQILRAESDAVLSSAVTVLTDNALLNVRWTALPEKIRNIYNFKHFRQPIKVIIDTANRITPSCKIIQGSRKVWLARLCKDNYTWPSCVEQLILPSVYYNGIKRLNLFALMKQLAYREINNLLVEAGASLSGALLSAGLVDELVIYQTPKLLGADARPLCILPKIQHLSEAMSFRLLNVRQIGPDLCLQLRPIKKDNFL